MSEETTREKIQQLRGLFDLQQQFLGQLEAKIESLEKRIKALETARHNQPPN